jgi:hypothetical protein
MAGGVKRPRRPLSVAQRLSLRRQLVRAEFLRAATKRGVIRR